MWALSGAASLRTTTAGLRAELPLHLGHCGCGLPDSSSPCWSLIHFTCLASAGHRVCHPNSPKPPKRYTGGFRQSLIQSSKIKVENCLHTFFSSNILVFTLVLLSTSPCHFLCPKLIEEPLICAPPQHAIGPLS